MAELDCRHRALTTDELVDPPVLRNVRVVVDAGAVIGLSPARFDGGLFAEDDAGAAHRELAEMHEVIVGGAAAVFRRVLAHRRDDDAIARGDAAQFDWGKKQREFGWWSHVQIISDAWRRAATA